MPYDERDEDTGRFDPKYTDGDFIDAIESGEFMTTKDVTEAVGCAYRTTYERLKSLEEDGYIESQDIGHTLVWSVSNDEE